MCGKIKNWNEFQHFKDRSPPWIKLYKYLLDDPEWHSLSGDDAKYLVMLWLIASEDKTMSGNLPEVKKIAFRLRISETETNQLLNRLSNWLILDDIKLISERYQNVIPEERRGETEKNLLSESGDSSMPNCPIQDIVSIYHESLPMMPRVRVMTKARETQIRQRWREDPKRQNQEWWQKFFGYVAKSDFLTGKSNQPGRDAPWMADLEWLTKAGNFVKVIEGKYHA